MALLRKMICNLGDPMSLRHPVLYHLSKTTIVKTNHQPLSTYWLIFLTWHQCAAACCSVLQRVAVRCSVLRCVAVWLLTWFFDMTDREAASTTTMALCCITLQHIAVCCSVLQCVAVCCSVLQCVAAYGSVLQCDCWRDSLISQIGRQLLR